MGNLRIKHYKLSWTRSLNKSLNLPTSTSCNWTKRFSPRRCLVASTWSTKFSRVTSPCVNKWRTMPSHWTNKRPISCESNSRTSAYEPHLNNLQGHEGSKCQKRIRISKVHKASMCQSQIMMTHLHSMLILMNQHDPRKLKLEQVVSSRHDHLRAKAINEMHPRRRLRNLDRTHTLLFTRPNEARVLLVVKIDHSSLA